VFTALIAENMEDDEYRALQLFLAGDPKAGDVMPGTGGFRKLRWLIDVEAKVSVVDSG